MLRRLLLILLIAAVFRSWLILSDGVSFDSDEAVVGLMAHHINAGQPIPTFYYGQDYMGSLDALFVALGFRVMGESVHAIRFTQMILYLLSIAAGYALAYEVTRRHRIASMTALILAIPTMLGALYTTITLGGYNELILLGSLILLFGWQVTVGKRDEGWRWALLGLLAGLGWWVNGAIITPCAVVGLLGLRWFSIRRWRLYLLVAAMFMIGSAPWWIYNLRHDWNAFKFLTEGFGSAPGTESMSPGDSLIGLLLLGLPTIYGLRFPWEAHFVTTAGAGIVFVIYLILIADVITGLRARRNYSPAERLIWLIAVVFGILFIFSAFSDATGRYLMPLWVPAALGLALGLDRLRRAGWVIPAFALGLLLAFQAGSVIRAARSETGLQPQLVDLLQNPSDQDDDVLRFLDEQGYRYGYAGYWTSFRLMFRSHEALILDTSLPYDDTGYKPSNNRYPPYIEAVAQADRVVWITQNFPALDAIIERRLADRDITYQTRDFGVYRVYYDFSARVAPADVGLESPRPLE